MIYLYTGLNGSGKSTSCLYDILKELEATGRPFFSSGIRWTDAGRAKFNPIEIEPSEWRDCPDGALILIDEAQNSMPARPASKDLPEWINELGTHRHKGHDIYLTTPHPMQIDVFARRLVGVHRHMIRAFSFGSTTQLENEGVMNDPTSKLDNHKAIVSRHKLRKSVFPYFQSASIHTHKTRLPKGKIAVGFFALALLGGGIAVGLHVWHRMTNHPLSPGQSPVLAQAAGNSFTRVALPSLSHTVPASSGQSLSIVGSIVMAGKTVYLVADSKGELHQAVNCRVVNDAPTCALGASVVTWPDVAPSSAPKPVVSLSEVPGIDNAGS